MDRSRTAICLKPTADLPVHDELRPACSDGFYLPVHRLASRLIAPSCMLTSVGCLGSPLIGGGDEMPDRLAGH
jgi:hypothetical protein